MLKAMILTILEVLALVGALAYYLLRISATLNRIGGRPQSNLAKIDFGTRAIAKETSHLGPQVTKLNENLVGLAGKLKAVDAHLSTVAEALPAQKRTLL